MDRADAAGLKVTFTSSPTSKSHRACVHRKVLALAQIYWTDKGRADAQALEEERHSRDHTANIETKKSHITNRTHINQKHLGAWPMACK